MLSSKEYEEKIARDRAWAEGISQKVKDDPRSFVKYRESRPIYNIKQFIESSVETYGKDHPCFYQKFKKGGEYEMITYGQMLDDVNGLGTALIDAGLKDKRISVIGENCSQWAISYLAVLAGTGIVVPLDKELKIDDIKNLLIQAEVSAVIFTKKYEKMFKEIMATGETKLEMLICMHAEEDADGVTAWRPLIEKGKKLIEEGDRRFLDAQIDSEAMSVLLFTAGTTGVSKGVMLSQRNLCLDVMVSPTVLQVNDWDVFYSVLPLHHTYECTCGFLVPLYKGAAMAYCEGLKYLAKNLGECHPTMFLGVPVMFEKMYKKIWQNVRKQGKEKLLKRVIKINRVTKKIGIDLGNIFFKQIREVFGGKMRLVICGGAAINPEVLDGIRDFGINALQGYGLTECAPMGALSPDTAPKSASCGVAFPTCGIEIINKDDDGIGEIVLSGENVMLGYYNMPEQTAEVKIDGKFHTGDLGYLDDEGYLYITGRQKNVIITKNGKNVFPEELEYYLANVDLVEESMVFEDPGESKDDTVIVAAVKLDAEELKERWPEGISNEDAEKELWKEIEKINESVPFFKRIRKVILRDKPFEMNTANKIKRFAEGNKR